MALKRPPENLSFESIPKKYAPKSNYFDNEPGAAAEPTEDSEAEARASEAAQDAREPKGEELGEDPEPAFLPANVVSDPEPKAVPETSRSDEK